MRLRSPGRLPHASAAIAVAVLIGAFASAPAPARAAGSAGAPILLSTAGAGPVVSVSAGGVHTCALTVTGGVRCWGDNDQGQLGDGTLVRRSAAVPVGGLSAGARSVSAGGAHTCAVTTAGGVKCWGDNYYGQLGDGTTTTRTSPVPVPGLSSGVVAVAAGSVSTCAVTTAGAVWCWGDNTSGEVGDGSTTPRRSPAAVVGLSSPARSVSVGFQHACAVTTTGLVCWGDNLSGQLGDGTTTSRSRPGPVTALGAGVTSVSAGVAHTCAVGAPGKAWCWGGGGDGQLGVGDLSARSRPTPLTGLGAAPSLVSSGGYSSCGLVGGRPQCWGNDTYGQLGDGTAGAVRPSPTPVLGPTGQVAQVDAGDFHACEVTSYGRAFCWGNNLYGQLGDGTTTDRPAPVAVKGQRG